MPAYDDEHHHRSREKTKPSKPLNEKCYSSKRFTDSSVTTNSEMNTSNYARMSMNQPTRQSIDILAPDSLKGT